jgi:ring-1,2-phenylacetyl-CoA epoxidase subunit PaaD
VASRRIHLRPPQRPWGDLVSEHGTHVAIARARAGLGSGPASDEPASVSEADGIRATVAAIPDPELPVVSIGDLGMIHRVDVSGTAVIVTVLPTFVGCPALDVIKEAIVDGLAHAGRSVTVEVSFAVPWTSDRISPAGRTALAAAGIAPPADPADVRCPYCASATVVMDSAFGPTQCRSLFYCRDCRQPFEAMKPV